jgi:crotonobetainyl-CoA:carnitine CoA-transferase CaiB-like acyl-CoA transferase
MDQKIENTSLLSGIRVLDLTDEKGFLCGKILGDIGADVIKIEKPGGDPSRRIGPFYHDRRDPEKSLYWFAYNHNKRGITLNIETGDGQGILKRLIGTADMLIESFPPGYMESLGLGYPSCSDIHPRLIMVSITPFGQTGPYRDFKGCDIVCTAMSGFMYICGDGDKPPVRAIAPQAYLHAGAEGAAGAMMAYYYRQISGQGQHVDISMQESLLPTMIPAIPYWELEKLCVKRYGSFRVIDRGGIARVVWPCKDGYVNFLIIGGITGARTNKSLSEWMVEEGMLPDFMREIDWDNYDLLAVTQEEMGLLEEFIGRFFMTHTKAELYEWAIKKRAMLYPVSDAKDLLENEQLNERNFWLGVEHPELGDVITYPGPWAISSEVNLHIRYPAPLIGEHNQDIYERELGMSKEEYMMLKQSGII